MLPGTEVAPSIAKWTRHCGSSGSGASLRIERRKSVDSTLGFTALDGLCMGTRPGALDPGVVLHLFQGLKFSAKEVETLLYKKSGLLGISGISNDMRDLLGRPESEASLAVDYFVYRAAKEIGALAAVLGGVDGLVFTAGIGENSAEIRERICEACLWLGVELDEAANANHGPRISTAQSKVSVWAVPTNEELMVRGIPARCWAWLCRALKNRRRMAMVSTATRCERENCFSGRDSMVVSGRKSTYATSFNRTTSHMKKMNLSWLPQPTVPKRSGRDSTNSFLKSERKAYSIFHRFPAQ